MWVVWHVTQRAAEEDRRRAFNNKQLERSIYKSEELARKTTTWHAEAGLQTLIELSSNFE